MIHAVTGSSDDIDISVSIEEVIRQCRQKLGTTQPRAGILFTSCMDADFKEILDRILREFRGLQLIGCTTDGEITRQTGFIEDSLSLLLLSSDTLEFATAVATDLSQDAKESLRGAYQDACRKLDMAPACAFIFPDGLTTVNIALDEAFIHAFGDALPVFGGTSGDHYLFTGCYQFHNGTVYSDAAPMLVIGGDVRITSAVRTGPLPTGNHFNIDRHEKNIVYAIDGKSAVEFFQEHLGEYREEFSEFPLAVYEKNQEDYYLRDPIHLNEEDGSIAFIGTFPAHCTIRLTLASRDDVLVAAELANLIVLNNDSGMIPELILLFPCTWVRHILGTKTDDTFKLLRQAPGAIPFFGFYCYGEIAPFALGTPSRFHNDSYVITALSTRKS